MIEIGKISNSYTLHPGSGEDAERKVWEKAVAWLQAQGAWPD